MKTKLLILFFISAFNNYAQTVNIPDANFKACLVANTALNTNGDSEIQLSEASSFTGTIACSGDNISDVAGVEAFTEIISLQLFGNNLIEVNVSQNTKLEQLLLEQNSLSGDLDLSALTSLVDFKAHTNNLTNINIANGNNANFTRFQAQGNGTLDCIQIDSGFTPNNLWLKDNSASYNAQCTAFLSVEEFYKGGVALYPNPATTLLNIEMPQNLKQAKVYSVLGEVVLNTKMKAIDVSNLKSGLYLISIETENGTQTIKRFIKQ
jgi:hypothetical protein